MAMGSEFTDCAYRLPKAVFERLEIHLPSCAPPEHPPAAAVDKLRQALNLVAEKRSRAPN